MLASADSIDGLDIARHGGMRSLFTSVYAPSTLGSFFRTFTHGHVRQLQAAARDTLIGDAIAGRRPRAPCSRSTARRGQIAVQLPENDHR
jgi:hypothetical protein